MNWKEKVITKLVLSESKDEFLQFIEAEIIEKLIEEIPDDLTYDRREGIWHEVGTSKEVKQQLKAKWLGKGKES